MGAGVEDVGALLEQMLGAVSVVDVEIEDRHPLGASAAQVLGGDGHVVEEAEAHGERLLGMVPRRADRGEGVAPAVFRRVLRRRQGGRDGGPGGLPGACRKGIVGRVEQRVAPFRGAPEALDVGGIVDRSDRRFRHLPRHAHVGDRPAARGEVGHHAGQPVGALRVAARRPVIETAGFGKDTNRAPIPANVPVLAHVASCLRPSSRILRIIAKPLPRRPWLASRPP